MKFFFIGLLIINLSVQSMEKSAWFDIKNAHDAFLGDFLSGGQSVAQNSPKPNTIEDMDTIQKLIQTKTSPYLIGEIDYEKAIVILQKQLDEKDTKITILEKELEKSQNAKLAHEHMLKSVLNRLVTLTENFESFNKQILLK